jgi:thiamine pyrophosphokinase
VARPTTDPSDGHGQRPVASPSGRTVVVLAGGDAVDASLIPALPDDAVVIAADSGLAAAHPLGLTVDRIVGDLDSVDPELLADARRSGIPVEEFPEDKDRTDLAIALDTAIELSPRRVVVVGGHGGRLDHLLGNAALLASPAYRDVEVIALMGAARVTVLHGREDPVAHPLAGRIGELISLLAFHGPATGITTTGLRFPLEEATLASGSSLGVSNEFAEPDASVALRSGVLLAVQPGQP